MTVHTSLIAYISSSDALNEAVVDKMRYAIARDIDGNITLTVFENGAACSVELSNMEARWLAEELLRQ